MSILSLTQPRDEVSRFESGVGPGSNVLDIYANREALASAYEAPPDLDDRTQFVRIAAVPILDEHYRTVRRDDGLAHEFVDVEQLRVLAENTNARAKRGDLALLTLGHFDLDKPESELAPIVGYADNFRMGSFRDQEVIVCDYHIKSRYRDNSGELREGGKVILEMYPRRSIEVFGKNSSSGYIDAISFLRRSPERDLGLITYQNQLESYAGTPAFEEGGIMEGEGQTITLSEKSLHALISGIVHGITKAFDEHEEEVEDEEERPEPEPERLEPEPEPEPEPAAAEGEEPEKMAASAGVASGTNTAVPEPVKEKPMPKRETYSRDNAALAAITHERDALRDSLKKTEQRLSALERSANQNAERYRKAERRAEIQSVIAESSLRADLDEECKDTAEMTDAQFKRHLAKMKQNYARDESPESTFVPVDPYGPTRTESPVAREDRDRVVIESSDYNELTQFAKRNNIDISDPVVGGREAVERYITEVKKPRIEALKKAGGRRNGVGV